MPANEPSLERQNFGIGNLLYTLTVIFPSWAGAFLLLYVLLSCGLSALNSHLL